MKKGFTLIELLAVIVLIALISLIALPSITSQFTKTKSDVNEKANETLIAAAELYLDNNVNLQENKTDTNICVTLEVLVNNGNLKAPVKNLETGKNMDLKGNAIQVTYHVDNKIINDGKVGLLANLTCDKKIQ
jgi:type IV pilus assembly protein PilA